MSKPYRQSTAMLAITKASLKAQARSPSAIVFGFLFPLFFILIFGSLGSGVPGVTIAMARGADTVNKVYQSIDVMPNIVIRRYDKTPDGEEKKKDDLLKGRITAVLDIQPDKTDSLKKYQVQIISSKASQDKAGLLQSLVTGLVHSIDNDPPRELPTIAAVEMASPVGDRIYRKIDYVLPGQLGFSLLSAGLFGISFLFFSLRETLVLKRFNATPLRRPYIILGEALARIIFQLLILSLIILIGKYAFAFTIIHGWQTYFELMVICLVGLFVFMGFGFVISGVSKNINAIPAITNIIGFPQFMLSGTFFPYESLPKFLHPIAKALPLTHVNDALRKISFEGLHLSDCWPELGILAIWALVIYAIAIKVFRWE